MAGNKSYFNRTGGKKLPLYEFFMALKNNGFLVTPQQILDCNRILSEYAHRVTDEKELGNFICPLFANTKEEQIQFHELFHQYFVEGFQRTPPESAGKKLASHLKKFRYAYIAAFVLIIVYLLWTPPTPEYPAPPIPTLTITAYDTVQQTIITRPNENVTIGYYYPTAEKSWQTRLRINWGDSDVYDTSVTHQYRASGRYNVSIETTTTDGEHEFTDTVRDVINVCNRKNYLQIISSEPENEIFLGDSVTLSARVSGDTPDSIRWIHDDSLYGYGDSIRFYFTNEGYSRFDCEAIYATADACFAKDHLELTITDPHKPQFQAVITPGVNAEAFLMKYKVKHSSFVFAIWFSSITFILLLFFLFWSSRLRRKNVTEKEIRLKANSVLQPLAPGVKTFKEIPFPDKNYLTLPEPSLGESARLMRRRISDETLFINIRKTIQRATENYGLFLPVYDERTQQSEFLVLIDQSHKNNLQVPLFNYLLDQLEKQGAYVHRYYYRDDFNLFYSKNHPKGITLEKLHDRHQKNILLIFGNGYPLLYEHYPIPDHALFKSIRHWKFQAVITPVPYPDWGVKERSGLLPEIALVPCDAEAINILLQSLLAGNGSIADELQSVKNRFHSVSGINFEDVNALRSYCNDAIWAIVKTEKGEENILFQWIAALALYPKIKWEILLSIGKAILDTYGKAEELNYTNLLRICRIQWIMDAQFPDYTRLDLLKELTPANEVAGRNAIISLLNEIPADAIQPNHSSYEEFQNQRVINEFNLYAHDPVKYARFSSSRDTFEKLWNDNKILDAPVKKYLKNDGKEWQTLIPDTTAKFRKENTSKASVDEFLKVPEEKSSLLSNVVTIFSGIISLLFLGSILWLLFLGVAHFINTNKLPSLTIHTAGEKQVVFFLANRASDTTSYEATVEWNSVANAIHVNDSFYIPVHVTDSPQHISIQYAGQMVLDTYMVINLNRYIISLHDADETPTPMQVTLGLASGCSNLSYRYKQILVQTGLPLIINDSLLDPESSTDSSTVCINQISFGKNIDESYLQKIVNEFQASGISLYIDRQSLREVRPNEILIYHYSGVRIQKPIVYIQYNNKEKRDAVKRLRQCMNAGVFECPAPELRVNNTSNEIRYYEAGFADSVKLLKECLQYAYPGRKFNIKRIAVKHNPLVRAEIWIFDSAKNDARAITKVFYENADRSVTGTFTYLGNLTWKEVNTEGSHLFKEIKNGPDFFIMTDPEGDKNYDRQINIKINFKTNEVLIDNFKQGNYRYLYKIVNDPAIGNTPDYIIGVGETFTLSLEETMPYKWKWVNKAKVSVVDSMYATRINNSSKERVGAPATLNWTFKGINPGTETIVLHCQSAYSSEFIEKKIWISVVRRASAR